MESIKCSAIFGSTSGRRAHQVCIFFFSLIDFLTRSQPALPTVVMKILVASLAWMSVITSVAGSSFPSSGPTVSGAVAQLRSGQAAAPENAPLSVKRAIWAANQLHSKSYRYGGGHHSFHDTAYDCSGTVSYALGGAGLINAPMNSSDFCNFGQGGRGKWITVYTRRGHTFAIIAGLRLDTTPYVTGKERWAPGWQPTPRAPIGFEARHPLGL